MDFSFGRYRQNERAKLFADALSAKAQEALLSACKEERALTTRLPRGVSGGVVRALRNRRLLHPTTRVVTELGLKVREVLVRRAEQGAPR